MIKTLVFNLALTCAPGVEPEMVMDVARTESAFNEFAVHVNGPLTFDPPEDLFSAIEVAQRALGEGYSVDIGLMQVNSANLSRLGVSLIEAFDPCINIRLGSRILHRFYQNAVEQYGHTEHALLAALSAYNTGSFSRGLSNGYVARYYPSANTIESHSLDFDPLYQQALHASLSVSSIKESLMTDKNNVIPLNADLAGTDPDLDRLFEEASLRPTPVRQDVADTLGVFEETALEAADVEADLVGEDDHE